MRSATARNLGAVATVLGLGAACHATGFNFTFDTDNQGWTRGEFGDGLGNIVADISGPAAHASQSGNGYLAGSDHSNYAFQFSPDLGGGRGGLFGNLLELDFRTAGGGGPLPFVVLVSTTAFLVRQEVTPASSDFLSYAYPLDASGGWYFSSSPYYDGGSAVLATDDQIQDVLDDLRYVAVSTDVVSGGDTTWTDNVRAIPAPGGAAIALMGAAAVTRRRRR